MTYRAPVADIAFALKHAAGFGPALAEGLYGHLTDDVVEAVLEEAGKFATDILAPLNAVGDRHGTPHPEAQNPVQIPRGAQEMQISVALLVGRSNQPDRQGGGKAVISTS